VTIAGCSALALAGTVVGVSPAVAQVAPAPAEAIWVGLDRLVWDEPVAPGDAFALRFDPAGGITAAGGEVRGGTEITLRPAGALPAGTAFPHLTGDPVLEVVPADRGRLDEALRGQQVVVRRSGGTVVATTGTQIAGALDARYAAAARTLEYGGLVRGAAVTARVWAPTAQQVRLRLFGTAPPAPDAAPEQVVALRRDARSGSWSGTGPWRDRYYQYEVTGWSVTENRTRTVVVTDPAALALSVGSTHAQFADLAAPAATPPGWEREVARGLGADPTEHGITELHVRDFSLSDPTVPAADRGTYRGFTHRDSAGMRHLRRLAEAGLDTVHLLPTYDIATIPERPADQRTPACDLPALPPDSAAQQECIGAVAASDAFNWGYDPLHYDVPEGSYATPDARSGAARTRQYREMVQALHANGNRVVLDVVYNHTTAAGDAPNSVLDKVVPGYHHRLDANGAIATSTCCANTAPENAMTGDLVVDSVVRWARLYKVDGFRFDLMGHHPRANILAVRVALDALTVERDGVDGRSIRIYGEGWNFGEVANDARFVQATQARMAGTGIGTFSDRLRDAVRGGGPFDGDPRVQGLGSGLAGDPNGSPANGDVGARLVNATDLVKLGMAGNLADYRFAGTGGGSVTGREVGYNGSPAGYAGAPADTITYVDAHDNETLYDALAYKLPQGTAMADRVRMQVLSLAPVLLGQGQPFVHAGTEFLRSKSLDRNSFDSGDWFNTYDPTLATSGFGRGLPPAADNQDKWPFAAPLLADRALVPTAADRSATIDGVVELLRIRRSSPLFTLGDPARVQSSLSFPPAEAGLVVAHLDDVADVDPARRGLLVVVNPFPAGRTVGLPGGGGWTAHPLSTDAGRSGVTADAVSVPARSVVVLSR
jgi:pullulanase-type alpha-1,6-glucosidase